MNTNELRTIIFAAEPYQLAPIVMDYFGLALKDAPQEKIDEFFIHFADGVYDAIKRKEEY